MTRFLPGFLLGLLLGLLLGASAPAGALATTAEEPPALAEQVTAGTLPPLAERLPAVPYVDALDQPWQSLGRYGGRLDLLMAKSRDLRQVMVYGYSRLVGYRPDLTLAPDILERVEVEGERVYTLYLRPGHRWSDGAPFTTEDFRYWWQDVANNEALSPTGPPVALLVKDEAPKVEILDETTLRYSWSRPHPTFLNLLAGASPLFIYRPAHYLKRFHIDYGDPQVIAAAIEAARQRNWAALHNRLDNLNRNDNPDLPTLDPWVLRTAPPSERFVLRRNPYFHRVDPEGRQLPYIDEVAVHVAAPDLIPVKTGAGESDLQARYIRFDNYTFLKASEPQGKIKVLLWHSARGSRLALYPNLTVNDPVYRALFRDVRFRRALSLAINRREINQVAFFGLAREGNNTVLPESPLFMPEYQNRWTQLDLARANRLLDEIGLTERDGRGIRRLPDGRPLRIIVETDGESSEETDVLQLLRDSWAEAGIALYAKPLQREVLRNRVYAGETLMTISAGLENGLPTADMSPLELAPVRQDGLQWARWGQHYETGGLAGAAPDMPVAERLLALYEAWRATTDRDERTRIWHEMLSLHADQVLTIGLVSNIPQPVAVDPRLRNLPEEGLYNWDPGAFFGLYHPDTFWFAESEEG
ncbi:MAG: ABC transporter substrate-binding protein [Kiloniellales bacterium]